MKVKVSDLRFSDELLELRPINLWVVSKYRQAMREGAKFPRIVIDDKKTIIAGNHRVTAYKQEYGDDYTIDAEVKTFATPREMVEYFARDNATHGLPLEGIEKKRITAKLFDLGADAESIASIFGVAVKRVEEWAGLTVCVVGNVVAPGAIKHIEHMPVKKGSEHMAGVEVTKQEYEDHNDSDLGLEDYVLADCLTARIKRGWLDINDDRTVQSIKRLRNELNKAKI